MVGLGIYFLGGISDDMTVIVSAYYVWMFFVLKYVHVVLKYGRMKTYHH